eukprot:NODE_355_length_10246_cov_0.288263.p6 type:complete len:119 gc:universal NODE_355_length_10246_cov_0.288263:507-863(+)
MDVIPNVISKEITNRYSIHSSTLRNWSKHGTIRCLSMPRKRSMIDKPVNHLFNNSCDWSYRIRDNRDLMAARNIHIKYIHPYSIPPQGSASVSNHCNGASSIASFSAEILNFLGNQDF